MQDAIELFLLKNVKLTALDGSIDLSTAAGRANVALQAVFAQLERDLIQERIKTGYEGMRQNRQPIRAPFGYKLIDGKLEIDRDVESIARWMRQSVVDLGLLKTAQAINDQYKDVRKIPKTTAGLKHWLQCQTIYGHLWYNRKSQTPLIYRNNHPALFTEQERQEVLESMQFRKRHYGFKSDPVRFPFSGLITCDRCGGNMQVYYKPKPKQNDVYYRCHRAMSHRCENHTYTSVRKIESAVIDALVQRADIIAEKMLQDESAPQDDPQLIELRNQLAALERMPSNPHIDAAKEGIKADIAILESRTENTVTLNNDRVEVMMTCANPEFWKTIEPEDKHKILRFLIKDIVCDYKEVQEVKLWV